MPTTLQPVFNNVASPFTWKMQVQIASNVAPNNTATRQIKVLEDSFFCLMAFRGSTNYDAFSGDLRASVGSGPAAATILGTPPAVPSNFEVFIRRQDYNLTGIPVPQAAICSSGYHAGNQLPIPILYAPSTVLYFDFFNTAPTLQNTNAGVAVDLRIDFGLFGYNVPIETMPIFLASFEELRPILEKSAQAYGIEQAANVLTGIRIPGLAN